MTCKVWILAIALLFIFEGLVPFVTPKTWIEAVRDIGEKAKPEVVRRIGLILLMIGVSIIWAVSI
jgi:uncharacterized protein YjeT (DUF2065 family)